MSAEVKATGELAGEALRDAILSVEAVHHAIARRAFGFTGGEASPVKKVHDALSAGVYAGVRGGLQLGARGGALLASATEPRWRTPERERRGAVARSAVNGVIGDELDREGSPLAVPMAIRVDGADVPPTPAALAIAFPDASPRAVVFVHGLCESDANWRPEHPRGYAARLRADTDLTPIGLRYNTGLRIADNGRRLAALVEQLTAAWPVQLREIAFVGHSMGGLVVRAAFDIGTRERHHWVRRVRHAVYLGSPHGGAPLEKGAALLVRGLQQFGETRPLAATIERRSAGIKDLGRGVVGDGHLPLAERVSHHVVAATLGAKMNAPLSIVFGDLLVRHGSATGRGGADIPHLTFEEDDLVHLPSATHFSLLSHPAVYQRLRSWLAADFVPQLLPGSASVGEGEQAADGG